MISQRKREDLAMFHSVFGERNDIEERQCALNKIFGQEEAPKDKRIRELEAENADLKNQLRDALERC